jgi:hypothetical protein
LTTSGPKASPRAGLWTGVTVFVHAALLVFWIIDIHVLAPDYVEAYIVKGRAMTPFLGDVLRVYQFMEARPLLVWASAAGVLLADGLFYHYLLRRNETALGRVWAVLLGMFFFAVAALTFATFWIARSDIWSTGYVSP